MKKFFLWAGLTALCLTSAVAQQYDDNSILLVVGSDTTTRGDFLKAYAQNLTPGDAAKKPSRQDMRNYLDLYTDFRLKVMDAKDSRYDTIHALQSELAVYRQQLAKPYVMDVKIQERLEKEAMEYINYDVFARHILVALPLYPSPQDTIEAYKKICMIRDKLVKGANFADMAYEYSDDVKPDRHGRKIKTGREGEMGYFTVQSMIYEIEQVVYNMRIGELSQPIRSAHGYHVVQLLDRKPALGKVDLSHILIPVNGKDETGMSEINAKKKIDSAYALLQQGVKFADVVRQYSQDKQTALRGGFLGTFAVNRMAPEVIAQLYSLKEGEYTKPFKSRYGWQIVLLMKKTGVPPEGDAIEQIRYGIEKMDRGALPYKAFSDEKLKTSHWVWDEEGLKELQAYYKSLPTLKSISKDSSTNPKLFKKVILTFEGQPHRIWEFMHTADKLTPNAKQVNSFENWFDVMKLEYLRAAAVQHEYGLLEGKHPAFAKLMSEYRDGVYLFEINNRKVWAKALADSAGLEDFFKKNRNRYRCPEMIAATVISYDLANPYTQSDNVGKFAKKVYAKKMSVAEIQAAAAKQFGAGGLKIDSALYAPGQNVFIDNLQQRKVGLSSNILVIDNKAQGRNSKKAYAIVTDVIPSRLYELSEVRGTVMNDYQAALEAAWLKELRAKYKVELNKNVFESIFE